MTKPDITTGHTVTHGENLRNAIRWLSEQSQLRPSHLTPSQPKPSLSKQSHWTENLASLQASREAVEKASLRFDLTPLEEEFLIRHFVIRNNN